MCFIAIFEYKILISRVNSNALRKPKIQNFFLILHASVIDNEKIYKFARRLLILQVCAHLTLCLLAGF